MASVGEFGEDPKEGGSKAYPPSWSTVGAIAPCGQQAITWRRMTLSPNDQPLDSYIQSRKQNLEEIEKHWENVCRIYDVAEIHRY